MSRNSAGTYTSPIPNFTPGSTIRSQDVNEKFADIGQALTASLDRTGNGGMQAPFKAQDGSAANPAITFNSEPGLGFFRGGAASVSLVASASVIQEWNLTLTTINRPVTVTTPLPNTTALTATGNGTGQGGVFTGGVGGANLPGARGVTTTGGAGSGTGNGGVGLSATGGASGPGVGSAQGVGLEATGGIAGLSAPLDAPGTVRPTRYYAASAQLPATANAIFPLNGLAWTNAVGVNNVGLDVYTRSMGTLAGWQMLRFGLRYDVDMVPGAGGMLEFGDSGTSIARGSAATATSPVAALTLVNAHLAFANTVVAPSGTTGLKDTLTPKNICKAWAVIGVTGKPVGSGTPPDISTSSTEHDTFNIASVTGVQAGTITVTFATPFASNAYKATVTVEFPGGAIVRQLTPRITARSATGFTFYCTETKSGGTTDVYLFVNPEFQINFHIDCQGRQ